VVTEKVDLAGIDAGTMSTIPLPHIFHSDLFLSIFGLEHVRRMHISTIRPFLVLRIFLHEGIVDVASDDCVHQIIRPIRTRSACMPMRADSQVTMAAERRLDACSSKGRQDGIAAVIRIVEILGFMGAWTLVGRTLLSGERPVNVKDAKARVAAAWTRRWNTATVAATAIQIVVLVPRLVFVAMSALGRAMWMASTLVATIVII